MLPIETYLMHNLHLDEIEKMWRLNKLYCHWYMALKLKCIACVQLHKVRLTQTLHKSLLYLDWLESPES